MSRRSPNNIARSVFIGFSTFVLLVTPHAHANAQGAEPAAVDLLRSAADALQWTSHYSSVTNVRYRATAGTGTRQLFTGTESVVRTFCDADRLHIIVDLSAFIAPNGALVHRTSRRETVFNQDGRTTWWCPADAPMTGQAQVAKSPPRINTARLIEESNPSIGAFLDGKIDGLGSIFDLVKAETIAPEIGHEQVAGIDCDVIDSRSPSGHIKLWIAPSKSFVLAKYRVELTASAVGATDAQFEATGFMTQGDRTFVRAGRQTRHWIDREDRQPWAEDVSADRAELDTHPSFTQPNLFTTRAVPNGLNVHVEEMRNVGVDFIWQNGGPVAKVDTDLFSELDDSVHKTAAGKVSTVVPTSVAIDVRHAPPAETGRVREIWMCLGAAAAIGIAILAAASIRNWSRHAG